MIRFRFRSFQSYALLKPPASMPTTHDFLFHDTLSVRVRLPLLLPCSNADFGSYLLTNAGSACMTLPRGNNLYHVSRVICCDSITGRRIPLRLPAMASPVAWRHQLPVVASSNRALK